MVDTEPECITDEVSASLLQRSVLSISNLSQRDPLVPFYVGSPLSALMRIFASGVHRCPLVNERGQFVSMVAQRDVLALFWTLRSHWESLGATACRDVSPLIGRVKSVHERCGFICALIVQCHLVSIVFFFCPYSATWLSTASESCATSVSRRWQLCKTEYSLQLSQRQIS